MHPTARSSRIRSIKRNNLWCLDYDGVVRVQNEPSPFFQSATCYIR
jgi:hypothetical protein